MSYTEFILDCTQSVVYFRACVADCQWYLLDSRQIQSHDIIL